MKKNIHPPYHSNAVAVCGCGAKYNVGSIKKEMHTEVCAVCHPFFTGKGKLIDTAGRAEKFRARQKKARS
jgi:large subunit ribosomal protein L31